MMSETVLAYANKILNKDEKEIFRLDRPGMYNLAENTIGEKVPRNIGMCRWASKKDRKLAQKLGFKIYCPRFKKDITTNNCLRKRDFKKNKRSSGGHCRAIPIPPGYQGVLLYD